MQKKKYINFSTVGFASAGAFSLITLALLLPTVDSSVHATCADGDTSEGCVASMASMDAEVTVGTSIAIAMDSKVTMDITPSSTGSVSAVSSKVQVMTNSIDGYALFMKADPELVNTSTVNDGAVVNSITNTSTTDTLSNMAENTYGYSISANQPSDTELMNSTYQPLDTTGTTPIRQTTSTSIGTSNTDYGYGEEYYLNLGVKVGTNLPAGTYAGTVTLSAVANPVTVRSMAGLTYMQDITHDICANTIEHYTKRLTDTRDGNKYWVAKLRDGNCWMTQNLALDLSTERTLTSGDTDLIEGTTYTPSSSTNARVLDGTNNDFNNAYGGYSWNLGEIVRALPEASDFRTPEIAECDIITPSIQNIENLCYAAGYVNVGTGEWQPLYDVQPGVYNGQSYDYVAVNELQKTYDAHYLIGNFYQYGVATANTGDGIDEGDDAESSICPKNWRLPTGGTNADYVLLDKQYSFYRLLRAYGYPEAQDYVLDSNLTNVSFANGEYPRLDIAPFYLVRAGYIHQAPRAWQMNITNGYYRLSTNGGSGGALMFIFDNGSVYPSGKTHRSYFGVPVRCLAR